MPTPKEPTRKKEGLKLAQLASYDDFITDALVDRVYFWTTIRKNRSRYAACRGIKEEQIADIIRKNVVVEKDLAKATTQLLELSGLKNYMHRLGSMEAQDHFKNHLRKYVAIYMPDSAFEVTTTNRYTIDTQEASVTARRDIKKGETIKYLSGIQVPITREELEKLDLTRSDFSIVMSSRKKTPSLFLGPARFANHDCDANSRLTTKGCSGMQVVTVREVELGEEITVTYGDDYFGIDNCECLCGTCEDLRRNGWAVKDDCEVQEDKIDTQDGPYSLRGTKRRSNYSQSGSTSRASTPEASTPSRKRKFSALQEPKSNKSSKNPTLDLSRDSKSERTPSKLSRELQIDDIPETTVQDSLRVVTGNDRDVSTGFSPPHSGAEQSPVSEVSTAATSISDPAAPSAKFTAELEADAILLNSHSTATSSGKLLFNGDDMTRIEQPGSELTELSEKSTGDSISAVVPHDQLIITADQLEAVASAAPGNVATTLRVTPTIEEILAATSPSATVEEEEEEESIVRLPGDYTLTKLLLATPNSRWVCCGNCEEHFVQPEAHQTRAACPRCERHSKLYGYQWPKTDKAGKHDTEERITDHRTIHRFVHTEEEKAIRKGKKGLDSLRESMTQESVEPEAEKESTPNTRGGRKRPVAELLESPPKRRRYVRAKVEDAEDDESEPESEVEEKPARKRQITRKVQDTNDIGKTSKDEVEDETPVRNKRKYVRSGKYVGKYGATVRNYSSSRADTAAVVHKEEPAANVIHKEVSITTTDPSEATNITRRSSRRHTKDTFPNIAHKDISAKPITTPAPAPAKRSYVHSGKYTKRALSASKAAASATRSSSKATPRKLSAARKPSPSSSPERDISPPQKRKYVRSGKFAKHVMQPAKKEQEVQSAQQPLGKLKRPSARRKNEEEETAATDDSDLDTKMVGTIKTEEAGDDSVRRTSRVRKPRITM